ncbi:ABC transporter ATP-binding protein [Haloplanus aerogenes]|uniref:ABC transporter ATP-binding protein n=1 Tax=Haloplanus aerogenes TaxID=660522 RepID=A0A3M0DWW7_9EURY|nr:ABC transporter ATP-binding protein [Haloplanus aerogenes]AZH25658.1 ABC transporter ATP-binding protein [Haloplanus aerogenes]RMB25387.1 ABC-type multidrug transport system ATPase subunit [Haloplanus aerogenes]
MTDKNTYLHATDVHRTFGDVTALSDVSIDIPAGSVVALIGPNGSGKTTLLRILAGLLAPSDGEVTYDGPDATRPLGYLPQAPTFRPGFSTRETIAFYARLVDDDPDELLDRVGLDRVPDRRVEALSGGMTRLLGIAQALAGDPPVLALDEPASGLDPGMSRRVFDIVEALAEDGHSVVVTSHDLPLVERAADRVVVLDRGEVVAADTPAALRERTGGPLHETFTSLVEADDSVAIRTEATR